VAGLIQGYYTDRYAHPWRTIFNDIEKHWTRENQKKDVSEAIVLLRDAVFSAFDILSLSIALDIQTREIVSLFTNESNWKDGRRRVRSKCIELAEQMIKKRKTRYLIPSALKRDGFGFLISDLQNAELETFKKARPKIGKIPKRKCTVLDLRPLEKSRLGSKFLKEQMVMEHFLEKKDSRVPIILEAFDRFLIDYEIDSSSSAAEPVPTEQITLNGTPVSEIASEKADASKRVLAKEVQSPLSDYIEMSSHPKKNRKKSKKPSKQKKRRARKK
jgi:hypothetical protein